jgi:hypothetical protein
LFNYIVFQLCLSAGGIYFNREQRPGTIYMKKTIALSSAFSRCRSR